MGGLIFTMCVGALCWFVGIAVGKEEVREVCMKTQEFKQATFTFECKLKAGTINGVPIQLKEGK